MWLFQKESNEVKSSDYKVGKILNKGTNGEVVVALNKKGKTVVLKKIDSTAVDFHLINTEVECGKKLKHSNIVKVFKSFTEEMHTFLEMEYLEGSDLFFYMQERDFQPLNEDETKKIFKQLVKALTFIHQKGYVHRDLKLENVFVCKKTGKVKLLDFGLAAKVPQGGELSDNWCGSIGYVCPEIMMRSPYDGFKADVWSLGTILYALLFAELPFHFNERVEALTNNRPHPPIKFPEKIVVSSDAKDLVLRMLEPNAEKRISLKGVSNHPWMRPKFPFRWPSWSECGKPKNSEPPQENLISSPKIVHTAE